ATATEVVPTETQPPTIESASVRITETELPPTPIIAMNEVDNQLASSLAFIRRNGLLYTAQQIMIVDKASVNLSGSDIIFIVLAEIDSQNSRRDCVYASDIRLYLDGN